MEDEYMIHLPDMVRKAIYNFLEGLQRNDVDRVITNEYVTSFFGARYLRSTNTVIESPVSSVFSKWIGRNVEFTIILDDNKHKIFPAYIENGEYHKIPEDMMMNHDMWQEMASAEHRENRIEEVEFNSGRGGVTFMDAFHAYQDIMDNDIPGKQSELKKKWYKRIIEKLFSYGRKDKIPRL